MTAIDAVIAFRTKHPGTDDDLKAVVDAVREEYREVVKATVRLAGAVRIVERLSCYDGKEIDDMADRRAELFHAMSVAGINPYEIARELSWQK